MDEIKLDFFRQIAVGFITEFMKYFIDKAQDSFRFQKIPKESLDKLMIKHYGEISGVPIISENMFLPDYLFNQICYQQT